MKKPVNPNPPDRAKLKSKAPAFERQERKRAASPARFIAYDFETTRIEKGTPRPLYLTAYGESPAYALEMPIRDMNHLHDLIIAEFLTPEFSGLKFMAWNANNFDSYFIAAALVTDPTYTIRPYLTRSNSLRGMRVMLSAFLDENGDYEKGAPSWEFLDGMAVLGLTGVSLKKFLDNFAPDHKKLAGVINFETETFNPKNRDHRDYAMRDSVGLYHAMARAQTILIERFNQPLTVTMGGACIKIFQAHIPRDKTIYTPPVELDDVIRQYAMRGGFCYCVKRYQGPVWKYDLNQAYAAAMREARLPAGFAVKTSYGVPPGARVYIARIRATKPGNLIPFYYRTEIDGRMRALFGTHEILDTWITSIELMQLRREKWKIEVIESWCFSDSFNMREYVDKLEVMRTTCEGGPSGPIGTMIKMVGNHSYGKTVEQLEPVNYLLSAENPPGYAPFYGDGMDPLDFIYFQFIPGDKIKPKNYHQPQIGTFITAHVRMVVRRAAMLRPHSWLYADTDCVVFDSDVTDQLDTDPKRYGAWKIEESGTEYQIIAKKVYTNIEKGDGHAKGLNVKRLTPADFNDWYHGAPPVQDQTQRQNFMMVMQGAEMYRTQTRRGTRVELIA